MKFLDLSGLEYLLGKLRATGGSSYNIAVAQFDQMPYGYLAEVLGWTDDPSEFAVGDTVTIDGIDDVSVTTSIIQTGFQSPLCELLGQDSRDCIALSPIAYGGTVCLPFILLGSPPHLAMVAVPSMEQVSGVSVRANSAYSLAQTAQTAANEADKAASQASSAANAAHTVANQASSLANTAYNTANAAKAVTDTRGKAAGLATLDADGRVPASQMPAGFRQIVFFKGTATATPGTNDIYEYPAPSTSAGGAVTFTPDVKYNKSTKTFVVAPLTSAMKCYGRWTSHAHGIYGESEYYGNLAYNGTYYTGPKPKAGVLYHDLSDGTFHYWDGTNLVQV